MALQGSALFAPDLACPEPNVIHDREDGRLRFRKQTSSDSRRKVGLETWGQVLCQTWQTTVRDP
jgi:hypothetical protein